MIFGVTVHRDDNRCKGICFLSFAAVVRERYGESRWQEIITHLPAEFGEPLRLGGITCAGWYAVAWYRFLHAAAQEVLGGGRGLAREIGRVATRNDLGTGVYKIFTRVASPSFIVSGAARLFGKYYERGTMSIVESTDVLARAVWQGCIGFDQNLWEDVIGGCVGALEAAGAKNALVEVVSGAGDTDDNAVAIVRWS
jgi:hypothetical protein